MENKSEEKRLLSLINPARLPNHIAIIMDGNGRWARERGLPRQEGHRQGVETVREIVRFCSNLGIGVLTLFAFSTENWKRPPGEVNFLMSLPEKYFKTELPELIRNNVKVNLIGEEDKLPRKVRKVVREGAEATKDNSGMILNFALSYGGRWEITEAVNRIIEDVRKGIIDKVDDHLFSRYLCTAALPDPDLLIRTSGEYRISNFLLWQIAYSELWYTETMWPSFTPLELLQAVYEFQQRKRRFGKV